MTAASNLKLPKSTEKRVSELTQILRTHWKKSTEAVLEVGKCLHELKQLLLRKDFIAHVKKEIGLSEKHAMRLIEVYRKFGNHKSMDLLNARPTVLYQLAYTCSESQISALASGRRISTRNGNKNISQIKVGDICGPKKRLKFELERDLATFFEETQDELSQFKKLILQKKNLNERAAIKATAKETMECLKELISVI